MQDSADQKTPQPSSPADAATPLEPPSLLHNPAVTIPNPAAPSSSTSCFPGERAGTATEFSDRLADFGPELTESTWTRVFQQTSGHCLAGQAVLQGAQALGHDLAAVDADRFRELLSTDVLIQIRSLARDTPELRLAHLLSFVHTITDDTIAMAAAAMPYLGPFSVPLDPQDTEALALTGLTARLVEEGLVLHDLTRAGHFTMSPVLRMILRRIYDGRNRHSEARSRRAVGSAAADVLRAPASYQSAAFDEALVQAADTAAWEVLAQTWAAEGHRLFVDHFAAAIDAYTRIPEEQSRGSAVLAEAMSDALQVDEARRRLDERDTTAANEAIAVINTVRFEHSAVPSLQPQTERVETGTLTVDDILTMAIASMRRSRHLGDPEQGLEAARRGKEITNDEQHFSHSPSRLLEARYYIEWGITALFAGNAADSAQLLRRCLVITELSTTTTPFLLLPAHAFSSLAHAVLGNGASSDEHLKNLDELVETTGLSDPDSFSASTLARMIRAMDRLELDSAAWHASRLADPPLGHHSWIGTGLYRALLGILRGEAGLEEKRLQQAIDTNRSTLPSEGSMLHRLQHSLACIHLAQGRIHLAQNALAGADADSPLIMLARARIHLSSGEYGTAESLANRVLSLQNTDQRVRASARAIQAAGLIGNDRHDDAADAFVDVLEYCTITGSVQSVALLPKSLRDRLLRFDSNRAEKDPDSPSRAVPSLTCQQLTDRLLSLGETLRSGTDHVLLSPAQVTLLALLDNDASIAQIATELNLVEGTVKNKLSGLYSRLRVRNRKHALIRGYEYGYLPSEP